MTANAYLDVIVSAMVFERKQGVEFRHTTCNAKLRFLMPTLLSRKSVKLKINICFFLSASRCICIIGEAEGTLC